MDLFKAIKERRSCRSFLAEPVSEEIIETVLDAAAWAPSPMNAQPWNFIVITNQEAKEKIYAEADRCRLWAIEKSDWKWLGKYRLDFLKTAPAIIAVVGDPKKTGMDMFQEEGRVAYQHACAAAIQNMHLAAHAMGLGTLWFTLFDKNNIRDILGIDAEKTPLALICMGKPDGDPFPGARKDVKDKITYMR
jgi:nitroreductase